MNLKDHQMSGRKKIHEKISELRVCILLQCLSDIINLHLEHNFVIKMETIGAHSKIKHAFRFSPPHICGF